MRTLGKFVPNVLKSSVVLPKIPLKYADAKISDEHLNGPSLLRSARDMRQFKNEAMNAANQCVSDLRRIAASGVKSPQDAQTVLNSVDCLSNVLCLILDPLDFILATNSLSNDPEFLETANDIFLEVSGEMAQLNTETFFWDTLSPIESTPSLFASLHDEQKFLVKGQVRDLTAGGIHLPREQRDLLVKLTNESTAASRRFQEDYGGGHPSSFSRSKQAALLKDVTDTLRVRYEMTSLLRHKTFAAVSLEVTAASSVDNVLAFLQRVGQGLRPRLHAEMGALRIDSSSTVDLMQLERAVHRAAPRGVPLRVPLEAALEALRTTLLRTFALEIEEVALSETESRWGIRDLRKFYFFDTTRPPADRFLGTMYLDPFARPGKSDGAGHYTLQVGCAVHPQQAAIGALATQGTRQKPMIVLSFNYGDGSSLAIEDVETLFHEAGHAVHSMVGQCASQQYSGTRATLDFCEFPSQLLELYPRQWGVVNELGGRFRDAVLGGGITQNEFTAALGQRAAFPAFGTLQQVALSMFDVAIHNTAADATHYSFPSSQDGSPVEIPRTSSIIDVYRAIFNNYMGVDVHPQYFWHHFSLSHFDTYACPSYNIVSYRPPLVRVDHPSTHTPTYPPSMCLSTLPRPLTPPHGSHVL